MTEQITLLGGPHHGSRIGKPEYPILRMPDRVDREWVLGYKPFHIVEYRRDRIGFIVPDHVKDLLFEELEKADPTAVEMHDLLHRERMWRVEIVVWMTDDYKEDVGRWMVGNQRKLTSYAMATEFMLEDEPFMNALREGARDELRQLASMVIV